MLTKINDILNNKNEFACDNTLPNLFIWNPNLSIVDDMIIIKEKNDKQNIYRLPIGSNLSKGIEYIRGLEGGKYPTFFAPEGDRLNEFKNTYGSIYTFIEDTKSFDYLYLTENLAYLPGKKYHSKRNHISAFSKKFNWHFECLSDTNIEFFKKCSNNWYSTRGNMDSTLQIEKKGVDFLFDNYNELNVKGGGIFIDNKVVAFTLGTEINNEVFDICIEKALPEYIDAYSVINCEFAKTITTKYINREDDMGIEGLRKAKMSYHPTMMIKKYYCYAN